MDSPKIYKSKTTIFFNKCTSEAIRDHAKLALGVLEIKQYEQYLELPSLIGINKKVSFNYIKERVWKKIQGWKENYCPKQGKKCLSKLWSKSSQHIPRVVSNCRWVYV